MLNKTGVSSATAASPVQILADVDLQMSIGCVVPTAAGVAVGSKTIAKAGTPITVDLKNVNTAAVKATTTCNAVLLHDVDVTSGSNNGTALIFGFVNENRVESDVKTALDALTDSGNVVIVKL